MLNTREEILEYLIETREKYANLLKDPSTNWYDWHEFIWCQ